MFPADVNAALAMWAASPAFAPAPAPAAAPAVAAPAEDTGVPAGNAPAPIFFRPQSVVEEELKQADAARADAKARLKAWTVAFVSENGRDPAAADKKSVDNTRIQCYPNC